ncbi:MAG: transaldolase, partial [Candidatus Omnitrophota bacterium]
AFLDHGRVEVTIEKDLDKARSCLAKLKSLGIDIDETCQEIQDAGVTAFQNSFDKLIHAIEKKLPTM